MNEQIEAPTKESPKFHEKSGEYCYKQMEDFDQTYGMMCPIDYLELTNFARKLETHISSLEAKNKLLAEAAEVGVEPRPTKSLRRIKCKTLRRCSEPTTPHWSAAIRI